VVGAGASHGRQAVLDNLGQMFTRWGNQAFNVTAMVTSDENVSVFGDYRYKSHSLGKAVSSPFSILVKVIDGKVTYPQFLEDSYATASSTAQPQMTWRKSSRSYGFRSCSRSPWPWGGRLRTKRDSRTTSRSPRSATRARYAS
jgi:hypothetical protein